MNKIIKPFLLLFILTISLPSLAQRKERRPFTSGHEIRLSAGVLPAIPSYINFDYWDFYSNEKPSFSNDNYNNALYNNGPRITTGAVSLNYSYNILRWLSIGATFTYNGDFQEIYSQVTKEKIEQKNTHTFLLSPMLRFNYINKPIIRLYSQIGVGLGFEYKVNQHDDKSNVQDDSFLTAHITFIGISVGRSLFGFAELGFGSQGVAVAGIGYKF